MPDTSLPPQNPPTDVASPPQQQPQAEASASPESPSEGNPAPQEPSAKQEASGSQRKILIVEDEKPLSHALEMKLTHQGFAVDTVMNGQDAINKLGEPFSLMLLDLIMPQVDGFAVLSEIKNRGINLPVIVLSNLGQEEDRKKAKELGAVNYFVKSNTPISEIVACVTRTLS